MRLGRNNTHVISRNLNIVHDMRQLDYKTALNCYAKEAVAALYWCENPQVLVDKENHEVDWLDTEAKKNAEWKPLWKILEYYPYTTYCHTDIEKEISQFNFSIDGWDTGMRGIVTLLHKVWFGYVDKKYHKADNKTALKIQNRLTNQIVYLGWYDGRFTVTELPARQDDCYFHLTTEINED